MAGQTDTERFFLAANALLRSIAHKMRTPLSVLSNELTSLSDTHPELGAPVLLGEVRKIADLLKRVVPPGNKGFLQSRVAIRELFTECSLSGEHETLVDKEKTIWAIKSLLGYIRDQNFACDSPQLQEQGHTLRVSFLAPLLPDQTKPLTSTHFHSLTEWASLWRNSPAFEPSLVDLTLITQGILIDVVEDRLHTRVTLEFGIART